MTDYDEEPAEVEPMLANPQAIPAAKAVVDTERFEGATPVSIPRTTPAFELISDPESYIISCCLLDEGKSFETAHNFNLTARDFKDRRHQTIFKALSELHKLESPIGLDTLVPQLNGRLEDAGGITFLLDLSDPLKIGTTTRAAFHIAEMAGRIEKNERISKLKEQLRRAEAEPIGPQPPRAQVRPITSYAYPSEDDPNTLLGNDDYLGRGGGMLFVSHAGAGKSSWIMDACMMWAIGKPWTGIKCNGPLKSLIIQAEDSDRYIGKIFASFTHVNQLTAQQLEQLTKNCVIVRLKGVSGHAFESELSKLTQDHSPDLVIINPVYLYAEGDISRSEFAQPFLVSLDRVNRTEKFAYILIHHTGKPAKKDGKAKELDDWESAYMGFGSSYFANWPRCSALLEPVPSAPGRFVIKLGKGGLNAGITKTVEQGAGTREEPVTRIAIKHSTDRMDVSGKSKPVYYWEIDDSAPSDSAQRESDHRSGRAEKYSYNDYRSLIPAKESPGLTITQLERALQQNGHIPKGTLINVLKRWADQQHIEIIEVQGKPRMYRAML